MARLWTSRWANCVCACAVVAIAPVASSCGGDKETGAAHTTQSAIVAGPDEKSFEERYRVQLGLPLPEADFVETLKRLPVRYRLDRDRRLGAVIPAPRWNPSFDLARIQKVYVIEGTNGTDMGVKEQYRAYVDDKDKVVYLENVFVYPPIG